MKIIRQLNQISLDAQHTVLALGNFDGLHLGHQKILKKIVKRAGDLGTKSMVFTFEPHPLKILAPDRCPPLLTTFHERVKLFQNYKLEIALFTHFSREFAAQHPEDFIRNVLWEKLRVKEIYVGYNYAFGQGKKGGVSMLEKFSSLYSYKVQIIEEVKIQEERVSSTTIRDFIHQGNLEKANLFLGRPYCLSGKVIHGHGRGKGLGFPTANIKAGRKLIPKYGVYLSKIHLQDKIYNGVANIGLRPTYGESIPTVEVFIFNFQSNLYQEFLEIELMKRLRDEISFPNDSCLIQQIKKDVTEAHRVLEGEE